MQNLVNAEAYFWRRNVKKLTTIPNCCSARRITSLALSELLTAMVVYMKSTSDFDLRHTRMLRQRYSTGCKRTYIWKVPHVLGMHFKGDCFWIIFLLLLFYSTVENKGMDTMNSTEMRNKIFKESEWSHWEMNVSVHFQEKHGRVNLLKTQKECCGMCRFHVIPLYLLIRESHLSFCSTELWSEEEIFSSTKLVWEPSCKVCYHALKWSLLLSPHTFQDYPGVPTLC